MLDSGAGAGAGDADCSAAADCFSCSSFWIVLAVLPVTAAVKTLTDGSVSLQPAKCGCITFSMILDFLTAPIDAACCMILPLS